MIIKKFSLFTEAIAPSVAKKYMKDWHILKERYADKFKYFSEKYDGDRNAYRIYIPYNIVEKSKTQIKIEDILAENNYELIDYITGQAKFKGARNTKRIGQILNGLGEKELLKEFVEDPIRKSGAGGKNLLVCISRHPYDIAGSDTDRRWRNCMTIGTEKSKKIDKLVEERDKVKAIRDKMKETDSGYNKIDNKYWDIISKIDEIKFDGGNVKYILQDVKEGSLISYLIREDDRDIKDPIANLNIKPYVNVSDENDILLQADSKMYGEGNDRFKEVVENWVNEFNGKDGDGLYCLNDNLFMDEDEILKRFKIKGSDPIEIINKLIDTELTIKGVLFILRYFFKNDDLRQEHIIGNSIQKGKRDWISVLMSSIDCKKFLKNINIDKLVKDVDKYSKDNELSEGWLFTALYTISNKLNNTYFTNKLIKLVSDYLPLPEKPKKKRK